MHVIFPFCSIGLLSFQFVFSSDISKKCLFLSSKSSLELLYDRQITVFVGFPFRTKLQMKNRSYLISRFGGNVTIFSRLKPQLFLILNVFSIQFILSHTIHLKNARKKVTITMKFVWHSGGLVQLPALQGCEWELPAGPLSNLLLWCSALISCYIPRSQAGPCSLHSLLLLSRSACCFYFCSSNI